MPACRALRVPTCRVPLPPLSDTQNCPGRWFDRPQLVARDSSPQGGSTHTWPLPWASAPCISRWPGLNAPVSLCDWVQEPHVPPRAVTLFLWAFFRLLFHRQHPVVRYSPGQTQARHSIATIYSPLASAVWCALCATVNLAALTFFFGIAASGLTASAPLRSLLLAWPLPPPQSAITVVLSGRVARSKALSSSLAREQNIFDQQLAAGRSRRVGSFCAGFEVRKRACPARAAPRPSPPCRWG